MSELHLAPSPCNTCPYSTNTPSGIWGVTEYAKLPGYDQNPGTLATFHCHAEHQTNVPTVCRGWLATHADGVAVRLAVATGQLTPAQVDEAADNTSNLYPDGMSAFRAGVKAIRRPTPAARRAMERLSKTLPS